MAGLTGVRNVRDDIEIGYDADPVDVDRGSPGRAGPLRADRRRQRRAGRHHGRRMTLTGHVRTWAEHDAVVGAAWMASGVSDVRDDLAITG